MSKRNTATPLAEWSQPMIIVAAALVLSWWPDARSEIHQSHWLRLLAGGLSFVAGVATFLALLWLCRNLWRRGPGKGAV